MVNKELIKAKLNLIEEELVRLEEFKDFSFQEIYEGNSEDLEVV